MSDKKGDDFVKNLEEQLRDMLGKANLSFIVNQEGREAEEDTAPPTPTAEDDEVIDRLIWEQRDKSKHPLGRPNRMDEMNRRRIARYHLKQAERMSKRK